MSSRPSRLRFALSLLGAALTFRLIRYAIVETSMVPTLQPGDWVLGVRKPHRVDAGEIVVFEHPHRPGFELVKRVVEHSNGQLIVAGEAPDSVDSTSFGPIPAGAVRARLLLRYHPRPWRWVGARD